jgi:hypothetical protein
LFFDPNLSVVVVFTRNWINAKKKATAYYPGTNMQDRNLARIEHFRTSESGHGRNLRERINKTVSSFRN